MLRIDEISIGRATGKMSPTGCGSPNFPRKSKPLQPKHGEAGTSTSGQNTPHISKMLAGQFNPIAFMHRDHKQDDRNVHKDSSPFTELKEAFDVLDEDKDGLLSVDDLAKFMRLIGMTASNAEMSELILEFDSDGDGYLSYQDFTKVLNQDIFEGDPNGDIIREAFRQFDQDGTGYVTQADLCTIFQQLGEERLVTDELSEILREYNVCNEGAINYENMIEGIQDAYKKQNKVSHDQH